MFVGDNLANLRIMHGYSRKELSDMLGVTEQAVWQYENGFTTPKLQTVNELKRIFSVRSKYFYSKDQLSASDKSSSINIMHIAYRSKVLNAITKTQSEAKHVEFLDRFIDYITSRVSLPSPTIIEVRTNVLNYLSHTREDRNTQIHTVARMAREQLGLTFESNEDLMYRIEKNGVFVFEKAIGSEIDAYSLWTRDNRPYIILGNLKRSAVRRNFDIAHELGHLLLHYRLEFSGLDRREHKEIENEANLFASAFLLPEEPLQLDMKSIGSFTNPDNYLELKSKWKTSLQVLGYRAAQLELMTAKDHRNFYAAMHRKGYLELEPQDKNIPLQKPMRIKSIIDLVSRKGVLNLHHMLEQDWMVELAFFYRMTGIEPGFFNGYLKQRATSTDNIVPVFLRQSQDHEN